jgi:hypothetical protein
MLHHRCKASVCVCVCVCACARACVCVWYFVIFILTPADDLRRVSFMYPVLSCGSSLGESQMRQ